MDTVKVKNQLDGAIGVSCRSDFILSYAFTVNFVNLNLTILHIIMNSEQEISF